MKTERIIKLVLAVLVGLAFCGPVVAGEIIYVDADAPGPVGDGSSWTDAYVFLQHALGDAHSSGVPCEIWVAQGIYKPDEGILAVPEIDWRTVTFQLINNVVIKGGYAGYNESDPNTRDIELYETILSGDMNGDDEPNFVNNGDNSYHVVTGSGTDATAILDGFTITGGNAPYAGGGMYNDMGSPTVTNCTFSANSAYYFGSGMYNSSSSPTVTNCTFTGNSGQCGGGGGMCNTNSSPTVTNCTFSGNSAPGIFISEGGGGGMYNRESSPTLTNCIFSGNSAGRGGGGMSNYWYSHPTVTNCTFSGNSGRCGGGGMENTYGSSPILTNCVLWGDTPDEILDGPPVVTYCDVEGGWEGEGNIDEDPCFADTSNGDYHLLPGSPCIDAGDNTAVPPSVLTDLDGRPRIINGTVDMGVYEASIASITYHVDGVNGDNTNDGLTRETAFATIQRGINIAEDYDTVLVWPGVYEEEIGFWGDAITVKSAADAAVVETDYGYAFSFFSAEGPDTVLSNFVIRDSQYGIYLVNGSSPTLRNLTIVNNDFGISAFNGSDPDISNCIVWDNNDGDLFRDPVPLQARYSCIEEGGEGEGNISIEPLFADANNDDYHLLSERGRYWPAHDVWVLDKVTSPCIDGGEPNVSPSNERMPNGGRINMGAYGNTAYASMSEWPIKGDINNDGRFNFVDIAILCNEWLAELPWAQ